MLMPGLVVALAIATSVNFWLLIPALNDLKAQSANGQRARSRQCLLAPVALKVYQAERNRGVITEPDLDLLRGGLPSSCLK